MNPLTLTEKTLRQLVKIDNHSLEVIEQAFTWLAEDKVDMPPIMHIDVQEHRGDLDIKSAYVSGQPNLAVKIGSGFPGNSNLNLPTSSSLMAVMSSRTGMCEAVLLENGYLTNVRTGLAGAVAAKYLAPAQVDTVGVIGSGMQARFQMQSLKLVRSFNTLLVHGRNENSTNIFAEDMQRELGVEVVVSSSVEDLVRRSQIVVTTTSSRCPIVDANWLHPGLHITAMGADVPGKRELDTGCLEAANRLFCDDERQCRSLGELQYLGDNWQAGETTDIIELGQLSSGRCHYERSIEDITICDLTGMGVQDTAIAAYALKRYAQCRR